MVSIPFLSKLFSSSKPGRDQECPKSAKRPKSTDEIISPKAIKRRRTENVKASSTSENGKETIEAAKSDGTVGTDSLMSQQADSSLNISLCNLERKKDVVNREIQSATIERINKEDRFPCKGDEQGKEKRTTSKSLAQETRRIDEDNGTTSVHRKPGNEGKMLSKLKRRLRRAKAEIEAHERERKALVRQLDSLWQKTENEQKLLRNGMMAILKLRSKQNKQRKQRKDGNELATESSFTRQLKSFSELLRREETRLKGELLLIIRAAKSRKLAIKGGGKIDSPVITIV